MEENYKGRGQKTAKGEGRVGIGRAKSMAGTKIGRAIVKFAIIPTNKEE